MLFNELENAPRGTGRPLADVLTSVPWNRDGLIPAIAQDAGSGDVLMLAWMDRAALEETLQTGRVCYWSRSRQAYWRKGESSGHRQNLVEACLDCDGDTLLLRVHQTGPACHTNRRSCFYLRLTGEQAEVITDPEE